MILSMLLRASARETAEEIKAIIGYDSQKLLDTEIHDLFSMMISIWCNDTNTHTLSIANSLISQEGFWVCPEFKYTLQNLYRALVEEVDFVNDGERAMGLVNKWVVDKTENTIPSALGFLSPETILLLINAVYFKGLWLHKFDQSTSYLGVFYNKGNRSQDRELEMMSMERQALYAELDGFKALELPYSRNGLTMLLILPKKFDGLHNIVENLRHDFVKIVRKELYIEYVDVTVPKMHFEYSVDLVPVLKALGVSRIFNTGGHYRGFQDPCSQLKVTTVVHRASLDVSEEGSDDPNAEDLSVPLCALRCKPTFLVDHPFMFFIYDRRCDFILFIGHIEEF